MNLGFIMYLLSLLIVVASALPNVLNFGGSSSKSNRFTLNSFPDVYNSSKQVPIFIGRLEDDRPFQYTSPLSLPICDFYNVKVSDTVSIENSIGASLSGHSWIYDPRLVTTFNKDVSKSDLCNISAIPSIHEELLKAIKDGKRVSYWADGIPSVAALGFVKNHVPFIYTHRSLLFDINGDHVVGFTVEASNPEKLLLNESYKFSYSVLYTASTVAVEDRYRKLAYTPPDSLAQIDGLNLYNGAGFTLLLGSLCGLLFSNLSNLDKDEESSNSWSMVPANLKLGLLYPQVYRRPIHATVLSAVISIGCHISIGFLSFMLYLLASDTNNLIIQQMTGQLCDVLIACIVGSSIAGGIAGGSFVCQWGIRRWKSACLAQFAIPFMFLGIVIVQIRTLAVMKGTTLAWSFLTLVQLLGFSVLGLILHITGFLFGHRYSQLIEFSPPRDSQAAPLVATRPAGSAFKRLLILSVPVCMASVSSFGPLFLMFECLCISSFCSMDSFGSFTLHIALSIGGLLGLCSVLSSFCLLCMGDARWQWNALRTGVIWFIAQFVFFTKWLYAAGQLSTFYSTAWCLTLNILVSLIGGCGVSCVNYFSTNIALSFMFDSRKSE